MAGRPPLFESADKMQEAIDNYFAEATIPTITGLAYALGFESRQSFYDYESKPEFSYMIKRARLFVENGYELRLSGNSVAGSIFALKNMGWKDKIEQDLNHKGGFKLIIEEVADGSTNTNDEGLQAEQGSV